MAALLEYQCPCCAGKIEFDSASQQMKCPFCDTMFDVETLRSYDEAVNDGVQEDMSWEVSAGSEWAEGETSGMNVYVCNSCAGEIVAEGTTGASSCPYCGSPVVMTGQFAGDLKPDLVIPFRLDKDAAVAALKKHLEGKFLLPAAFKDQNHIDEIKALYVPFWMFDAGSNARIVYKATKVRRWDDSNYTYKETKYYTVIRAGSMSFENVPVDGSSKMPDDLMESIEPYDYHDCKEFTTAYLSGYLADKYDVTAEDSVERANTRIKQSVRDEFRKSITGFSTVTEQNEAIRLSNGRTRYMMCPVWILNTTWNDQHFLFAMNGQTGKFVGDLPTDMGKFWRWFFIFWLIFGAVAFGVIFLLRQMGII